MNALDRLIGWLAPTAGYQRALARARTAAVMNYDAASKGRRTYGWKAPTGTGDIAARWARPQLRQLSREMIRNRALAARASDVVVGAVIGTGISFSLARKTLPQEVRDSVDAVLRRHFETTRIDAYRECNLYGLQQIAMRAVFGDGEVLVRRRVRNPAFEPDLDLMFQIEVLEVDRLDTTLQSWGENEVAEGIEYGPTGRVEAYHLWKQHPGDLRHFRDSIRSERVPAANILHIRRVGRPEQTRGVPWLAPVMMTLGELGDYTEAQILKQRMAALLAAVVTTDDAITSEKVDMSGMEALEPGAIVNAPPGTDVKFTAPPQVNEFDAFVKVVVRQVAAGLGITYEALSGDLEGVNFSSGRMGHMVQDRNVEMWQGTFIAQFCDGLARWTQEAWALNRRLPQGLDLALDWTAPRRPLIDPTREIPAMIEEVAGGLSSMQRTQRRLGYDPDTIRRERVEDNERDAAAGLSPRGAATAAGANPLRDIQENP